MQTQGSLNIEGRLTTPDLVLICGLGCMAAVILGSMIHLSSLRVLGCTPGVVPLGLGDPSKEAFWGYRAIQGS